MPRFKKMVAGRGGWSEWVFPKDNYLMKCCDCGLVHEMQFKTFLEKDRKRGAFEVVPLPPQIRPMFRARRWPRTK